MNDLGDSITALSVYLTPKTTNTGNWIEIAYGTNTGQVRVIVQHPETVGHGPQVIDNYIMDMTNRRLFLSYFLKFLVVSKFYGTQRLYY